MPTFGKSATCEQTITCDPRKTGSVGCIRLQKPVELRGFLFCSVLPTTRLNSIVLYEDGAEPDDVLADRLTELDLEISAASTFDLISLYVLSLPLMATDTYSGFADDMPLVEAEKKHLNHHQITIDH